MRINFAILLILFLLFSYCNTGDDLSTDPEITPGIKDCLILTSDDTFEVITWNVKDFPLDGMVTITAISDIIKKLNPDLIAFQEIANSTSLDMLISDLPGWNYEILTLSDLNLAFLYKTSEVIIKKAITDIFPGDPYAFPRPPVQISISHNSGLQIIVINIHLKCCGGHENLNRRKDASEKLKAYIDQYYPNQEVILLGDFNNIISMLPQEENILYNFIEDNQNYQFTDMGIALGDTASWSYPSWPSHIDHILITNELFDNIIQTQTLPLDNCDPQYLHDISDHRPVILQLGIK